MNYLLKFELIFIPNEKRHCDPLVFPVSPCLPLLQILSDKKRLLLLRSFWTPLGGCTCRTLANSGAEVRANKHHQTLMEEHPTVWGAINVSD